MPEGWNTEKLNIISILTDHNGHVVNAKKTGFQEAQVVAAGPLALKEDVNVNIFPNPLKTVTNVQIDLKSPADLTIRLYNHLGQLVAERDFGSLSGAVNLPFFTNNLVGGLYYLNVQVNDQIVTNPIVIMD